ncbi:hypothetical protein HOY80DRAFT_943798 [Tuber brumale]|nr:hypothetical protein HOY80DRAFT_996383 [Tuber brumale]KAG0643814.1 hypothetical protein HOY80DRAFT_943798 [Tuber brumale]
MPEDHRPEPKTKNIARNIQALANAFQELANEMNVKQKQSIQEHKELLKNQHELLQKVQEDHHKLQKEMQGIRQELNQFNSIASVRLHNSFIGRWDPLKYPPGILVNNPPLPSTKGELLQMNSFRCQSAAKHLKLPTLLKSASIEERRKQIADYLGVPYQCNCM